jgi:hypothetical protein
MLGISRVSTITIAVRDQDEALRWFTERLGFEKRMDIGGEGMRWVTVAPKGEREVKLVLASWFPDRVGINLPCMLEMNDCHETFRVLKGRGVQFTQEPSRRPMELRPYSRTYAAIHMRLSSARNVDGLCQMVTISR